MAKKDTAAMADDTPKKKKKPFVTSGAWAEARSLIHAHRKRLMLGMALMLVSRMAGMVLPG